jgi:hypothetical protein
MEYPDKNTKPEAYIGQKLLEIQRADLSEEERGLAYKLGECAITLIEQEESDNIKTPYQNIIDVLEFVCSLLLKKRYNKNEIPEVKKIVDYSKEIIDYSRKSDEAGVRETIKKIKAKKNRLEAKVLSQEIINNMKGN